MAPAFEQSGVAHCVSYIRPMRIERLDERRFAVEGSPADCVLAAIGEILRGRRARSRAVGVNRGHNVAEDTLYSGTVGGAMEGALHGLRAIALSQYYGPGADARRSVRRGPRAWRRDLPPARTPAAPGAPCPTASSTT